MSSTATGLRPVSAIRYPHSGIEYFLGRYVMPKARILPNGRVAS